MGLRNYLLRRILMAIPSVLGIATFIFVVIRILPGDIAQIALEGTTDEAALATARHQLGIDIPIWQQYFNWLGQLATGHLGESFRLHTDLNAELARAFPVTAHVVVLALLIAIAIGFPAGIVSAVRRDSAVDYTTRILSLTGLSIPAFWLGIIILIVLSRGFNWIPPLRWVPFWQDPLENLKIIVWPALAVGYIEAGTLTRMVRSSVLEVLGQDHVRTARSKGLRERVVLTRHVLLVSMISVVTVLGTQVATLLSGLIVTETVFNLPGMGYVLIQAVTSRDYPTIQAMSLVVAVIFVLANLTVDLAYGWLDPRIRYA
jgi:peptide/nickel transport system permease protein